MGKTTFILAVLAAAVLAFASPAPADDGDPGTDGREIELCDTDAGTDGHREGGREWQCFPVCLAGTTVFVKAHYRNGWRMQRFMKRTGATFGPCGSEETAGGPARGIYCLNGKAADLLVGQPDEDPAWAGAVPATYVGGKGATCDYRGATRPGVKADGTGAITFDSLAALMPSFLYPVAA